MLNAIVSIGSIVFLGSIVWLVVSFRKKKPKRNALITLLVSFVLVGILAPRDKGPDSPDVPPPSQSEDVSSIGDLSASAGSEETGPVKSGSYTLPCGVELEFSDSVPNDKTGCWRMSTTETGSIAFDYAVEYYNEMFSDDDEIHAIINKPYKTTTALSTSSGILFVDIHAYSEREEKNADQLFGGDLIDSKMFDIKTGELIEPEQDEPDSSQDAEPLSLEDTARAFLAEEFELTLTEFRKSETGFEVTVSASGVSDRSSQDKAPSDWAEVQQRLLSAQSTLSGELGSPELGANLYLRDSGNGLLLTARDGEIVYDKYEGKPPPAVDTGSYTKSDKEEENQIQQEETSYVLNTNTMKFHKPGCTSVGDIAPENYSTYSGTRDGAISSGYDPCGRCHP